MRVSFEEAGPAAARKEYTRSDSDNWRILREEQEEEEAAAAANDPGGSWRLAGVRRDGTHTPCTLQYSH